MWVCEDDKYGWEIGVMVQEGCFDFYYCEGENGCCLKCVDAEEGCLCHYCKCKECYWYSYVEESGKGKCDLVPRLRQEGKENRRRMYLIQYQINYKKSLILEENNIKLSQELESKNKIPNCYSCQRCERYFFSEEDMKIIFQESPTCDICSGKINLSDKEMNEIRMEVDYNFKPTKEENL